MPVCALAADIVRCRSLHDWMLAGSVRRGRHVQQMLRAPGGDAVEGQINGLRSKCTRSRLVPSSCGCKGLARR